MQNLGGLHSISTCCHPWYDSNVADWARWRDCYAGGIPFRDRYLKKFSARETQADFEDRREITPIPAHAKSAINEIRDSIFQRLSEISRIGGSNQYQTAIQGFDGGVDRRGSSMNSFLGMKVLTDLLVMGKVGVYVDNLSEVGPTLAQSLAKPYLYSYCVEDIRSWREAAPGQSSEFQSVLLREKVLSYDQTTLLPSGEGTRFRHVWIDPATGFVNVQFYDDQNNAIDQNNNPAGPIVLPIRKIPFVLLDIGDSLLKDVAEYQIALLNMASSDVAYALKANFPFYTEQADLRATGGHLKPSANPDGTPTAGGQGAHDQEIKVGATKGRKYDKGMDRPDFIHPSPEPLRASMELQAKYEQDIRKLVHLAVENLAGRASAEAKAMENQGLEAGLSWVGLVMQACEQKVAEYWSAYESRSEAGRQTATVAYPARYSLKSDAERVEEATQLNKLISVIPGRLVKKEVAKIIATVLLNGRVPADRMKQISSEIEAADYVTSDPETVINAHQEGLVGDQLASIALGFPDDEFEKAREDHAERIERIQVAQGVQTSVQAGDNSDPGARGVNDLSADPNASAGEKASSRDTTTKNTTKPPVRGPGKSGKAA